MSHHPQRMIDAGGERFLLFQFFQDFLSDIHRITAIGNAGIREDEIIIICGAISLNDVFDRYLHFL